MGTGGRASGDDEPAATRASRPEWPGRDGLRPAKVTPARHTVAWPRHSPSGQTHELVASAALHGLLPATTTTVDLAHSDARCHPRRCSSRYGVATHHASAHDHGGRWSVRGIPTARKRTTLRPSVSFSRRCWIGVNYQSKKHRRETERAAHGRGGLVRISSILMVEAPLGPS